MVLEFGFIRVLVGGWSWALGFLPIWPVKSLDGLSVEVLYGLLVAPAYTVASAGVTVESVDGLCDSHLRGGHGYKDIC